MTFLSAKRHQSDVIPSKSTPQNVTRQIRSGGLRPVARRAGRIPGKKKPPEGGGDVLSDAKVTILGSNHPLYIVQIGEHLIEFVVRREDLHAEEDLSFVAFRLLDAVHVAQLLVKGVAAEVIVETFLT